MRIVLLCCFLCFSGLAISQYAYIPNRNSGTVSVINTPTNTVIATINAGVQPQCVAFNRPLNRVYIANNGSSDITVIDPCSNTVVATITCPGPGVPAGLAVSPNGQRIYVPMFNSNKLHVFNAATNTLITSITTATIAVSSPEQCVVSPDNSRVYLTLFDENKLAVIDATTNTVLSYQATDDRPTGLDISNDGTKLYVGNQNTSSLIVYNTATWARIATVSFGPFSPFGQGGAAGVVLNHANTFVYVAMQETSQVKVISTATNSIVSTVNVGGRPFGLDVLPDDSRLYVSCVDGNRVDVINTATNTNIQSIPVGLAPFSYGKFIFRKNLDSVRFNYTLAGCRTVNFQGLSYVSNGGAIATWQWSFGDATTGSGQNPSHTYGANGTYPIKLVVTDVFGCMDSITGNVNVSLVNGIGADNDTTVCSGAPFTLHAWGANLSGWSWTPAGAVNNPNAQNPIATITTLTKFYVTATHSGGCNYIDSITVDVKPLPNINTIPDTAICQFTTVQLTTTGGVSYSWSPLTGLDNPNTGNPIAGPLVPIKYYVTGTGANGCINIDSVTVTLKPAPTVNTIPDTSFCANIILQLTTTGTAASYSWSPTTGLSNPSISNPIATPVVPTKYYVTGTSANGCTNIDSVMVTPKALPNVNTIPDTAICNQTSVQLTTTGAAGYSWTPATGLSNPNIASPIATPAVPTKYYVTGTGANGCTNMDSVMVTLKPAPVINTIPDTAICQGSGVQLTTTGGVSYSWSPATGLSNASIGNPVATPLVPTKYYVTGTGANGCTNTDSVMVTLKALPSVNTTPDTSFCGTAGNIQLNTTGAVSYSWTPVSGLSNPNIANPVATPASTIKYYVTGTGANGCTNIDSVLITQKALPAINTIPDTSACPGFGVQLTTTGGVSYSWTPAAGLSNPNIASPIATPAVPTKYYVTGTGANGCTNIDSVMVGIGAALPVDAIPDTSICTQSSIQLQVTGATSYRWTPATGLSNPNISNPVATPAGTTKYYVVGTSGTGCAGIDSVTVTIVPLPLIVTSPDTLLCGAGSVQLNTTGGSSYFWFPPFGLSDPTIPNPIASPAGTTQYIVTGFGANGCSANDTVNIKIGFSGKSGLLLPGAFTPNGDGVNDCFGIKFYEGISELEFRIFNRWGENVFTTTNPAACWDGRYRGKINPGNYVYYLKAKTACTEPLFIKGNVILIR